MLLAPVVPGQYIFALERTHFVIARSVSDVAIPAGPTGPFVLSLSKDRRRMFSLIKIATLRSR